MATKVICAPPPRESEQHEKWTALERNNLRVGPHYAVCGLRSGHAAISINLSIHFSDPIFLTSYYLVSEANRTCCRGRLAHWTVRRGVRHS
jgi:hypothetical protein